LAARLGVERSTIQRWEAGETTPRMWYRPKLADALGLSTEQLGGLLAEAGSSAEGPTRVVDHPHVVADAAAHLLAHTTVAPHHPEPLADSAATDGDRLDLLQLLDHARLMADRTLSTGGTSAGYLGLIEDRVAEHLVTYSRTPPLVMLSALTPDLFEVQTLAQQRQPATIQARLSGATAVLGLLSADALMKLGEVSRARYWYGTARLAADDTMNAELRARVRAQEAMLPYYYGRLEQTVAIARAAQALMPLTACDAVALAAAAESRALARLGDTDGAERAMNRAQHLVDVLEEPQGDVAFEFSQKRLLLYLSGTLTYLGQHVRAQHVQDQALDLYRSDPQIVIDPALIQLDRAVGQATVGNVDDACQLAMAAIDQLPAEHRTRIVLRRATDVIHVIPQHCSRLPAVSELREFVATQDGGTS
jgi:transcriptional regulator with XRE-family HTH domain